MIFTMGGIGLACAVLIAATFQLTLPIITKNKAEALERAIFEVVPGAAEKATFVRDGQTLVPVVNDGVSGERYYVCYNEAGTLVGVAIEAAGPGFQDVLRIIYGYSPEAGSIVGLKVLESKETPGLGDKIEPDGRFRANFEALQVQINEATGEILNPIALAKRGEKTDPWQVEAITGATISSRAIANILRKSTAATAPVVFGNLDSLGRGAR
jgi:electron transport complex protein RnfG